MARSKTSGAAEPQESAVKIVTAEAAPNAGALQRQYDFTIDAQDYAVREAIKFGMMLREVEVILTCENNSPRRGPTAKGLSAWLSDNCPAIDYQKAMRWKRTAESVAEGIALPSKEADWADLLAAPADDPDVVAINEELDEVIDGRSLRQLVFDFAPPSKKTDKALAELYTAAAAAPEDEHMQEIVRRVEAGELAANRWEAAYKGMRQTKGEERPPTNYAAIGTKALVSLNNALVEHPALIGGEDQDSLLRSLAQILTQMPAMLREKLAQELPEGMCIGTPRKGGRG